MKRNSDPKDLSGAKPSVLSGGRSEALWNRVSAKVKRDQCHVAKVPGGNIGEEYFQ